MINYQEYLSKAIRYDEYMANMLEEKKSDNITEYSKYIPINYTRSNRIDKSFKLDVQSINTLMSLDTKYNWLVITEHWCGDSSQILPIINAVAIASNGKILLKIVYRDTNVKLMDNHLTNGARAIPKLLVLDENNKLIKDWGPRPKTAQDLVFRLKSNSKTAVYYNTELHKWYSKNKQKETLKELINLVSS